MGIHKKRASHTADQEIQFEKDAGLAK